MSISEVLEPLHSLVRELLERDKQGKSDSIVYTDDDVVAATLLYSHVLGNRLVAHLKDERASLGMSQEITKNYGALIKELTIGMAQVDTTTYYKKEGKK